jgi:hypothetical protein
MDRRGRPIIDAVEGLAHVGFVWDDENHGIALDDIRAGINFDGPVKKWQFPFLHGSGESRAPSEALVRCINFSMFWMPDQVRHDAITLPFGYMAIRGLEKLFTGPINFCVSALEVKIGPGNLEILTVLGPQ